MATNGSMFTGSRTIKSSKKEADTQTGDIFNSLYKQRTEGVSTRKQTSDGEWKDLWSQYKAGAPGARETLLGKLEPTIEAALTNLVGGEQKYKTKARLIALDSLDGFDPNAGANLSTYVYNRLQSLRRLSADRGNFVHVPEKSALERRQLEEIKRDIMLETGVEPSLGELADRSGMNIRKVGRLMSIFRTTSTSATRGEHGDSLEAKPRTATELYNDAFYDELPEMDKKIYEWSTGYRGSPMLDRSTMARKLKVSEAAISQHAKKIDQRAAKFASELNKNLYGDTGDYA